MEDWDSLLHMDGPISDFIFVPLYMILTGLHFKWYILYNMITKICNSNI
jgi:hypothetical protein